MPESEKYSRMLAIDRTRKIRFELAPDLVVGGESENDGVTVEEIDDDDADTEPQPQSETVIPDVPTKAPTTNRP